MYDFNPTLVGVLGRLLSKLCSTNEKYPAGTPTETSGSRELEKATSPVKLPIDGGESPTGMTWADIESEMFKKSGDGQLLRSVDINHERKIQKMMQDFGGNKPHTRIFG